MPKVAKTNACKLKDIVQKFNNEFSITPANALFCKICETTVKHEKTFFVESHRNSVKHKFGLSSTHKAEQTFLQNATAADFTENVVTAFLSADIPLKKLQNEKIKELFVKMGKRLPSESTCRKKVSDLADKEKDRVKDIVRNKQIFLEIDESEVSGTKYVNVLIGTLDNPTKVYMCSCTALTGNVNAQVIIHIIDDTIRYLNTDRENFCLLISDAAPYMISAAKTLKELYTQLFHVTCIAHLLHNCALRVKSYFDSADNLIARIKAATVKNKTRQDMFQAIGKPPEPIVTRWSSWLKAAFYYADNLPAVKDIVNRFENSGLIVQNAKASICASGLERDLMNIKVCYSPLVDMLNKIESTKYTIQQAHDDLNKLNFQNDPAEVDTYLKRRLNDHEINSIMLLTRAEVSPSTYGLLQNCQATSAGVERSFSMLGKILAKDRNFLPNNVEKYLILHFNSVTK